MSAQHLTQQELLSPPPRRHLVVPQGRAGWWGVDPSTLRIAVAGVRSVVCDGVRGVDRWVEMEAFVPVEGAPRLSQIYAKSRALALRCARERGVPGVVLLEQPSGKVENPMLSYAVGVIMAAVYDGLYSAAGRAVHVETVTSSHWKRVSCGNGGLRKPKRKNEAYPVLEWARLNGYAGGSWDCADAWAIAECAHREIGLVER
jgi:hypothetical protein